MLYLRTASGSFINSTMVVGLSPQHGEGGKIAGWIAVRADGSTIPLAGFYSAPGRIEKALPHLFPKSEPIAAPISRPRFVVPYTNKVVRVAAKSGSDGERGKIAAAATTDAPNGGSSVLSTRAPIGL